MRNSSTTRDTLLSAAAAEILKNGYAGASMAAIAARLDMTKGAFAYHFPAKQDLAVEISKRFVEALSRAHEKVTSAVEAGGLRALMAYILEVGRECLEVDNAAGVVLALDPHLVRLDVPRAIGLLEGHVRQRLTEAAAAGEVDGAGDLEVAVQYVTLQVIGTFVYLNVEPDEQTPELPFLRMLTAALGGHDPDQIIEDVQRLQADGLVTETPVFGMRG